MGRLCFCTVLKSLIQFPILSKSCPESVNTNCFFRSPNGFSCEILLVLIFLFLLSKRKVRIQRKDGVNKRLNDILLSLLL